MLFLKLTVIKRLDADVFVLTPNSSASTHNTQLEQKNGCRIPTIKMDTIPRELIEIIASMVLADDLVTKFQAVNKRYFVLSQSL